MEFNEKLQELRKQKELTQEELAEMLFVSRTAISKWESGRGYPSIDSLKAIACFFSVSLDQLLSGETVLSIAESDGKRKERRFRSLIFGLLDCSSAMLFFLPLFCQRSNGVISDVPLLSLTNAGSYVRAAFLAIVVSMQICGVFLLALQECERTIWLRIKDRISLCLNAIAMLLFIVSLQPYAAMLTFLFLLIKAMMLIKWS